MKNKVILIMCLVLTVHVTRAQSLNVGDHVPDIKIDLIFPEAGHTSTAAMKGKVVLLDFWATWCGSCIFNMPHLDSLQTEFADELQVIAISEEKRDRLERFSKNRPFAFSYAHSLDGIFQEIFPHRMIPHSVIINAKGQVVAITNPKNITKQVIKDVVNNVPINLPLKKDNAAFDYTSDYFNRDPKEVEAFDIQPYNPDIPGFTKFQKDGRRITMHNTTITGMYREAFDMSSYRLVLDIDEAKVDWENTSNRYNVDILVAPEDKSKLKDTFKEKLLSTLEIKAATKIKEMEVVVVSLNDSVPFSLSKSVDQKKELRSRADQYKSNGSSMEDFARYLERYGILGMPVVDETGLEGKYQFDFSFDSENSKSFLETIKKMGLKLKKEKRQIEVLVIYEETHND